MEIKYKYMLKIVLVGKNRSGKTTLKTKYTFKEFVFDYVPTIGLEIGLKKLEVKGQSCTMQIWDTPGQSRYKAIASQLCKGAHGCFIMFSVTHRETFEEVDYYFEHAAEHTKVLLVGCFCDLATARTVSYEEATDKAFSFGIPYIEVSAATGHNVDEAFELMAKLILNAF